jgi:XapX domain-containing protein
MKSIAALLLAFAFGFFCRAFGISAPAPPTLMGAALVAAVTAGYLVATYWMGRR